MVSTHFFLDDYEKVKDTFETIDNLDESKRIIMQMIWGDLSNAYKFGSLVRVDETLDKILPNDDNHNLFVQEQMEDMFSFKQQFMNQLRQKVNELGELGSNAYTLAKTNDAISFLEIIANKYDVVVANPPYTDSSDFGKELKAFIEGNYSKPLKFNSNLYACFIKRCCELAGDDGKVGMIHPHTFMFIKTFEDVRKFMLEQTHVNVMVDYGLDRVNLFGPGILLDATFYTLDMNRQEKTEGVYFNITANQQEKFKKDSLAEAYDDYLNIRANNRVYTLPQSKLKGIKSYPFIYWISDEFREKFGGMTIEDFCTVAEGCKTANNLKFLRFWWERNEQKDFSSTVYPVYAKGGEFSKWYGNLWLELLWGENGAYFKSDPKACANNEECYFKEGITFTGAGSKGVSFRLLPKNSVFDTGSRSIFSKEINIYILLALFNSSLGDMFLTV